MRQGAYSFGRWKGRCAEPPPAGVSIEGFGRGLHGCWEEEEGEGDERGGERGKRESTRDDVDGRK